MINFVNIWTYIDPKYTNMKLVFAKFKNMISTYALLNYNMLQLSKRQFVFLNRRNLIRNCNQLKCFIV